MSRKEAVWWMSVRVVGILTALYGGFLVALFGVWMGAYFELSYPAKLYGLILANDMDLMAQWHILLTLARLIVTAFAWGIVALMVFCGGAIAYNGTRACIKSIKEHADYFRKKSQVENAGISL